MREILKGRRQSQVFDFFHEGFNFTASLGFFDDGRPAELFLDVNGKRGTGGMDGMAHDLAVVTSLALQYGCPLEKIRQAVIRHDNDAPAGPLGQAIECFVEKS